MYLQWDKYNDGQLLGGREIWDRRRLLSADKKEFTNAQYF
jgi:hypothetical protein